MPHSKILTDFLSATHTLPLITLDARAINARQAGVRIYTVGLLASISKRVDPQVLWDLHLFQGTWSTLSAVLQGELIACPFVRVTVHQHGGICAILFHPLPFNSQRVSTLFPDYYAGPVRSGVRAAIVHDLAFRVNKKMFSLSQRFFRHAVFASHFLTKPQLLTISRSTAAEITHFYPALAPSSYFVGSGTNRGHDLVEPIYTLTDKEFVLSVGTLNSHKNYPTLIVAYSNSNLPARGIALVICGKSGSATSTVEEAIAVANAKGGDVRHLKGLSDEQIAWAYRNCLGTVLPSLYEGYGLPAAEAISCGSALCCSDIPALREAAGDAAVFFDATDILSMIAALEAISDRRVAVATAAQRQSVGFAPVLERIEHAIMSRS